jgi:hypothetical protein
MMAHIKDRLQSFSPDWAYPLLASVPQEYHLVARTCNDVIEMWHTPQIWGGDDIIPAAYQSVPKEWIAYAGVECFVAPAFFPDEEISVTHTVFWRALVGQRPLNPENHGGHVTVAIGRGEEYPLVQRSPALWKRPRQTQGQFNRRVSEISSQVELPNIKYAEFFAQYSNEEMVSITLGLEQVESGCFRSWASDK